MSFKPLLYLDKKAFDKIKTSYVPELQDCFCQLPTITFLFWVCVEKRCIYIQTIFCFVEYSYDIRTICFVEYSYDFINCGLNAALNTFVFRILSKF